MGKAENIVEQYLVNQAKTHECLCHKFISYGTRGVPDRVIIGHGMTIFVETKSDCGHLRKQQSYRIRQLRNYGALVAIIHTKEQVDAFYKDLCNGNFYLKYLEISLSVFLNNTPNETDCTKTQNEIYQDIETLRCKLPELFTLPLAYKEPI